MRKSPSLKISISGVRGIVGESLTPNLIASFSAAFGTSCGRGEVLVGTDTRPSRDMVLHAAIAGLLSVGRTPVSVGIAPVPTLQSQIRKREARGGICISASHNPMEWNALKFFGADGIALRPNQFAEITDLYHQGMYPRVGSSELPLAEQDDTAVAAHRQRVLSFIEVSEIRKRNFKVVVDCCNGAASLASPEFLRELGCEVVELHTDLSRPFPRNPEPIRSSLAALSARVQEVGADVGFAQDADADRLSIVNAEGAPLGENCTIALVARHVLARKPGPLVVNLSTSRMAEAVAREFDSELYRTKVGEINVIEEMLAREAAIGGEGNGGVIIPEINPCRDSFVAMAMILEAMAARGETVEGLRSHLPRLYMINQRVPLPQRYIGPFIRLLRHFYRNESLDLRDGIRVDWPDRWLHVRGSNTEPVLRIVAEAEEPERARELMENIAEYLRPLSGQG